MQLFVVTVILIVHAWDNFYRKIDYYLHFHAAYFTVMSYINIFAWLITVMRHAPRQI